MKGTSRTSARVMRGQESATTWQVFARRSKRGAWFALPEPPRFALLVSGGKVAKKVASKIRACVETIERTNTYNKVVVLDAIQTVIHSFMPHGPRYSAIVRYLDARETVDGGMRVAVRLVAPGGVIAAEAIGRRGRRGQLVPTGLLRPSIAPLAMGPLHRGKRVRTFGEMGRMFGGKKVWPARKARRA